MYEYLRSALPYHTTATMIPSKSVPDHTGFTDSHSYLNSEAIRPDAISAPTGQSCTFHPDTARPGPCIHGPPQIQGPLPVLGERWKVWRRLCADQR
jgi:hypothetical protein